MRPVKRKWGVSCLARNWRSCVICYLKRSYFDIFTKVIGQLDFYFTWVQAEIKALELRGKNALLRQVFAEIKNPEIVQRADCYGNYNESPCISGKKFQRSL